MSFFSRFRARTDKPGEVKPGTPPPANAIAAVAPGTVERRNRKRKNARQGASALIIDDSPTVVAALRRILRSVGYVTNEAGDAEQGLALLAQTKPDLIFLDIVLPGMNGFGALRAIRKDPTTQHIPVIMISGNEHATEQFYANKIGADDFMKKPFSRYEVFAHIEMLLDANRELNRKGAGLPPLTGPIPDTQEEMIQTMPVPRTAASLAGSVTTTAQASPAAPLSGPVTQWPELEARKQLTAMGLQYFDPAQFVAAIRRGDQLAVALFVAGLGVPKEVLVDGQTPLTWAQAQGQADIIQLLA
jgi:DNA-binding response OmpR family regulator